MDSPLAAAELSRLRKSVQQRDRLLSQGGSTSSPDLNISRALTNLKLYLPQSQSQLEVVLKDWNDADQAKKLEIVGWIRLNLLNDQTPTRATTTATTFVPPPPPPSFQPRANTLPSQFQSAPSPPTYSNSPVSERAPPSPWSNPTPSPRPQVTPTNTFVWNQAINTPAAPRELYTQATRKAPTPPPKDSRTSSTLYSNAPIGSSPVPALNTQSFYGNNSTQNGSNVSMSPAVTAPSPQSNIHAPTDPMRQPAPTYNISPNPPANTNGSYQQSFQYTQPQTSSPHIPHASNSYNPNLTNASPDRSLGGPVKVVQVLSQLASAYQKHSAQTSKPPTSKPPSSGTPLFNQASALRLLLEGVKKYQAHQAHQSHQAQFQSSTQSSGTDPTQMFASMQQQQQQQQASFDPTQYFAQFQQQQPQDPSQDPNFMDMMGQIQDNSSSGTGFDWSSLTGGSGVDMNSILSGMSSGGDNVDWNSVATMMGGVDPSIMTSQDAGLF